MLSVASQPGNHGLRASIDRLVPCVCQGVARGLAKHGLILCDWYGNCIVCCVAHRWLVGWWQATTVDDDYITSMLPHLTLCVAVTVCCTLFCVPRAWCIQMLRLQGQQ